jgi:hypothetical protein
MNIRRVAAVVGKVEAILKDGRRQKETPRGNRT